MGPLTEALDVVTDDRTSAAEEWEYTYVVLPVLDGAIVTSRSVAVFADGSFSEWIPADALEI